MILAELEVYHSRPVAPTRRVALGRCTLPVDPPPGYGGVLLGGVVAANIDAIDPDLVPDLVRLTTQLEHGHRVAQPRLRYRFQQDRVGLQRSRHRLLGDPDADDLWFQFDDEHGDPAQQLLGAVYAAGRLSMRPRRAAMGAIRQGIAWRGAVGPELIAALAGAGHAAGSTWSTHALTHPVEWALTVLGFAGSAESRHTVGAGARPRASAVEDGAPAGGAAAPARGAAAAAGGSAAAAGGPDGPDGAGPSRAEIQGRYRELLKAAHPDHGGRSDGAAQRIADLSQARRILLG